MKRHLLRLLNALVIACTLLGTTIGPTAAVTGGTTSGWTAGSAALSLAAGDRGKESGGSGTLSPELSNQIRASQADVVPQPLLPRVHRPPALASDPNAAVNPRLGGVPQTNAPTSGATQARSNSVSSLSQPTALSLFANNSVSTGSQKSSVDEPSVASNGNVVFYTGNWYDAVSIDGGTTFSYLDPFSFFTPPTGMHFCCDQRVLYEPSRDLMIWALMYCTTDCTSSAVRIAVARSSTNLASPASWAHWRFGSTTCDAPCSSLGFATGTHLDYPQLGLSANYLYVTANTFDSSDSYVGTVITRISLDQVASGGSITYSFFSGTGVDMYAPVARSGSTTMYWARHATTSSLRIFQWPESSSTSGILNALVSHSNFVQAGPTTPATIPICTAPDASNPCGEADSRLMGGWVGTGVLGFMWMAAQGTVTLGTFPYPYIHVVRINPTTPSLIDEPIIWNSAGAWAYPGVAANGRGYPAISAQFVGPANYPSSGLLVADDLTTAASGWDALGVRSSTAGPPSNRWGDFLTVAAASGRGNTWVATSYTLQGACANDHSNCANVEPRFLSFGRPRDNPAPPTATAATPSPTLGPTPTLIAAQAGYAVAEQINPAHTGSATGSALAPPLTQLWSVNLSDQISYPLIAGGKVFVTVRGLPGGLYGTQLYALDTKTGQTAWGPLPLSGTYFWSAAAYDNGAVFVINFDGLLRAFDAATGTLKWSAQLSYFSGPPVALQGTVYVGGAGALYAVDESTGAILWTAYGAGSGAPTLSEDGVFVSSGCADTSKFNRLNGALQWHHTTGCTGGGGATPPYYNGRLYVRDFQCTLGGCVLDAATGSLVGNFSSSAIPAFAGTTGFFVSGATLTATDLTSGSAIWTFTGDGQFYLGPVIVDRFVYVGSSSGTLYALDATTGQMAWSGNAGAAISAGGQYFAPEALLGAGEGVLVVPAGASLLAYGPSSPATATPATTGTPTATATPTATRTATATPVVPAVPSQLAFAVQPRGAIAGQPLLPQPVVALTDDLGSIVTSDNVDTVTLALSASGNATPGGMTATLTNGVATFSGLTVATPGTYTFTATSSACACTVISSPFTMSPGTITVSGVAAAGAPNPSAPNQDVTLTATASFSCSGAVCVATTGYVWFQDSGITGITTAICPPFVMTLSGSGSAPGTAYCTSTFTTTGAHVITAYYCPQFPVSTANPGPVIIYSCAVAGAVQGTFTQNVNAQVSSTTTLTASPNPATPTDSITFTAAVSGSGGTPTGTVAVQESGATLCSITLAVGSGTCSASLAAGTHTLTAAYSGDVSFASSTSASLTVTVNASSGNNNRGGGGGAAPAPQATQPPAATEAPVDTPVPTPVPVATLVPSTPTPQPEAQADAAAQVPSIPNLPLEVADQLNATLQSLAAAPDADPSTVLQALLDSAPPEVVDALSALSPEDQLALVQQLLNPPSPAVQSLPDSSTAPDAASAAPQTTPADNPSG